MLSQILETTEKYGMITPGDEIITALSGGADSVCLLLVLNDLRDELKIKLSAVHVNHCLRGEESDRDEQFCRALCTRLQIPLICGRFDVNEEAARKKVSTELAARDVRYRFFRENSEGKKIATAHNANDNAETVIFNLTRGTGTKGIAGIPPVRENIIRPLINVTRRQIEEYLKEKNQNYITDSTNLTDEYTRNLIRHNVIPVLEQINSSFFRTVSSDSENFRTDNSFIEAETEKTFRLCKTGPSSLTGLSALHAAVRRRCIARLLDENNIETSSRRITDTERICLNGGKINLSGNIYAVSENDTLTVSEILPVDESDSRLCIPLSCGKHNFFGKTVSVTIRENDGRYSENAFDADRLSGNAFIRNRLPQDRIKLAGKNFTSSVKKLFSQKVDIKERSRICFIADEEGPVFIESIGISERVRITEETRNVLEIFIDCD